MGRHGNWVRLASVVLVLAAAEAAVAAPLDPPTQQVLVGIYDAYSKAIVDGKLDAAMAAMSRQLRARAERSSKTKKDRAEALAMARMMNPDSVSVVHSFIDATGTHARLETIASKTVPKDQSSPDGPPPGTVVRNGMTLSFVKEAGAWKFDEQLFGADPSEAARCKNETADPPAAYDPDRTVDTGGPITRVDFKPDYTLVVYSVVGDANCAFLPPKAGLAKLGIDPAQLVPYALIELNGIAHRTDPQKTLAQTVKVEPEQ